MVGDLTLESFRPAVGSRFTLPGGGPELELTEAVAVGEPPADGVRAPFSLVFAGPADAPLGQGSRLLAHTELGELEIFLVPIAEQDGRRLYEAVFA